MSENQTHFSVLASIQSVYCRKPCSSHNYTCLQIDTVVIKVLLCCSTKLCDQAENASMNYFPSWAVGRLSLLWLVIKPG